MQLTEAQLAAYERDGFLVVKDVFSAEDLDRFQKRFIDIVERRVRPSDGLLVMRDAMVAKKAVTTSAPEKAIAKLQMFQKDPVLNDYIQHEGLLDCVQQLIGSKDLKMVHNMLINKPPGLKDPETGVVIGGRHPIHQDLLYFTDRPPEHICATWTALQDIDRTNGCLVVIPGSHRGLNGEGPTLYTHSPPEWRYLNTAYWGVRDLPDGWKAKRLHVVMKRGETVFFHPLLLHGSGRNRTDGFRRAISAHYADTKCVIVKDIRRDTALMYGELGGQMWRSKARGPLGKGLSVALAAALTAIVRRVYPQLSKLGSAGFFLGAALILAELLRRLPTPEYQIGKYLYRFGARGNHVVVRGKARIRS